MFDLYRGTDRAEWTETRPAGVFRTREEAMDHVGRPYDEWVRADECGGWFHGGGNVPGEYWVIRTDPA